MENRISDKTIIEPGKMPLWGFRYQHLPEFFSNLGRDLDYMVEQKGFYKLEEDLETLPGCVYNQTMEIFLIARLSLIATEVAEAIEAVRKSRDTEDFIPSDHIPAFNQLEEELADIIIRTLSLAHHYQLKLGEALLAKLEFQNSREQLHGGKVSL